MRPYLTATRKWIFACAIVPLFLLMLPVDLRWHTPAAALYHTAYGLALSLLLMEILFFGFRKAPFTCAHFPGKVNLTGLAVVYVFGFTAYSGTMAALESRLERYPIAAAAFLGLVSGAALLLSRLDRRRRAGWGQRARLRRCRGSDHPHPWHHRQLRGARSMLEIQHLTKRYRNLTGGR